MKQSGVSKTGAWLMLVGALAIASSAEAAVRTKADNQDALNSTSSWIGGVLPGTADTALFDASLSAGNSTIGLGAAFSPGWLQVEDVAGGVLSLTGSYTLNTYGGLVVTNSTDLYLGTASVPSGTLLSFGAGDSVGSWRIGADRTVSAGRVQIHWNTAVENDGLLVATNMYWGNAGRNISMEMTGTGTYWAKNYLQIGSSAGFTHSVNFADGTVLCGGEFRIGTAALSGVVDFHNASVSASNTINVAYAAGSDYELNLTGNTQIKSVYTALSTDAGNMAIGYSGSARVSVASGSSIAVERGLYVGTVEGSVGVLNVDGGVITNGAVSYIGRRGAGTLNITGGEFIMQGVGSAGRLIVGDRSSGLGVAEGTVNHSGGTMTLTSLYLGSGTVGDRSESAVYNLSGSGVLNVKEIGIGGNGSSGRMEMSGGTLDSSVLGGTFFAIGHQDGATGILNQTGGTLVHTDTNVIIGRQGSATGSVVTGIWTMSGDSQATVGTIEIAQKNSLGTLNLDGGVLSATSITGTVTTGAATLNFNGGTLQARASRDDFVGGLTSANIKEGGATIDANGFDVQINQSLTGTGTLTKISDGTLTLSGENSYAGDTIINGATLALSATGSISNSATIKVAAGATFDVSSKGMGGYALANGQVLSGSGTVNGNLIVADGAILAPGNSPGTLEVADLTWSGGGFLDWEVATNSAAGYAGSDWDFLNVTGSFVNQATSGDKFTINIKAWNGFSSDIDETWKIMTANDISGFSTDAFLLNDETGSAGTWSISADSQNLYLTHNAIPEPAVISLLTLAGAAMLVRRRMRKRE